MKILRFIVYILLVADLFIFAFFHGIIRASNWSLKDPAVLFVGVNLVLVLLVGLYDLLHFNFREGKKHGWLPAVVILLLFLVKLNPMGWPVGHKVKMEGKWDGKMVSGKIVLYESGLFELDWNGWARDGMYHGSWFQRNDKFFLRYAGKFLDRVGRELLLKNDTLFPLKGYEDAFLKGVEFTVVKQEKLF